MNNYKYYTPIKLAECLMSLVPQKEYKSVIDICCGSWNLLKAAQEVYPDAKYVGIDVDSNSRKHRIENARFYNTDGRKFAISQKNRKHGYDLILSNPPFGYLKDDERTFLNNKEAYIGLKNRRYENEMTQANLMLAHEDSVLMFILPNTFVEGITNIKARQNIGNDYYISAIIQLPDDTFGSSRISTYAIIMIKDSNQCKNTKLYIALYNNSWCLEYKEEIEYKNVIKGNWIDYKSASRFTIPTFRGNISSCNFKKNGVEVLHCSNKVYNGKWSPSVKYCLMQDGRTAKIAQNGDILINRVGKCAGYWTVNDKDNVVISDCIIVISNSNEKIIALLRKNSIEGRINVPIRGVSTKYITAQDLQALFQC